MGTHNIVLTSTHTAKDWKFLHVMKTVQEPTTAMPPQARSIIGTNIHRTADVAWPVNLLKNTWEANAVPDIPVSLAVSPENLSPTVLMAQSVPVSAYIGTETYAANLWMEQPSHITIG